jgi:hypothetical protein
MSQFGAVAAVAAFGGLAFLSWREKVNGKQMEKKVYEVRAFRHRQRPRTNSGCTAGCASRGGKQQKTGPLKSPRPWLRQSPVLASGQQFLLTSMWLTRGAWFRVPR